MCYQNAIKSVIIIFCRDISSSASQFIKGKSRDLQKLLRYLRSRIGTFTFKNDTDCCAGCSACLEFWSWGNLSGVSPTIPVLH